MKKNKNILLTFIFLTTLISCATVEPEYSLYRENGKYGLINARREIVLSAEYDEIQENEVYLCQKKDGNSYVYDGELTVLHEFDSDDNKITIIAPWLFYFSKGDGFFEKWYLYSLLTNETTKEANNEYFEGNNSNEPWVASRYEFYSKDMQQVSQSYGRVYPYRENRAVIVEDWNEPANIIDENFSIVVSGIYASADYYSEGLIPVEFSSSMEDESRSGKSCYLDVNGNIVYECDFRFAINDRFNIKHLQNKEIIGSFYEQMAVVKKSDKSWLILDRDFNKHYLPEGYEVESYSYSNGLLLVSKTENKEKKYGFVDKNCNVVIPCEFSYAESFDGKYAIVEKEGKDAVIDKKGKIYYCSGFKTK